MPGTSVSQLPWAGSAPTASRRLVRAAYAAIPPVSASGILSLR
ncbi:hypothetical protein [Actinomadura sp. 21ATH]